MLSRITAGIDYTFTLFPGAGVSWRPCELMGYHAIPSMSDIEEVVTGANTPMLRRCCSTSAADIRFVFEQFRVLRLAFPRYCPKATVRGWLRGSTDMSR